MTSNLRIEGSKRHVACHKCRQRKVKCDGRLPYCKRCASGGVAWDCFYEVPALQSGKTSQLLDVQEAGPSGLATGQEADDSSLEHEDVCAIQRASSSCNIALNALRSPLSLNGPPVDDHDIPVQQRSIASSITTDSSSKVAISQNANMGDLTPDDLLQSSTGGECTQSSNTASTTYAPKIDLSSCVMDMLIFKYVESCQSPYFVFQDQARLSVLILEPSSDCVALRYAICALAISASPELPVWDRSQADFGEPVADQGALLYEAAKRSLALYEADQQSRSPSLRVLQTTILLGLYELRCAHFSQAWNTVSRAIWIAESLKLHLLEVHRPFPLFSDEDIDDARLALWATTGLTGFFSLSGRMIGMIGTSEIASRVPLSNPGFHISGIPSSPQLTMADIFNRTATRQLTVQEAMCACGVMFPRILAHVRTVNGTEDAISQPYSFWTNHQRFHRTIGYINSLANNASETEPALDMLLNAFSIVLHEAARIKRQGSTIQYLSSQVWSVENTAVQHALHISKVVQTQPLSKDCWATITGTWALYVALKSLLQRQQRVASGEGYPHAHIQLRGDFAVCRNVNAGSNGPITSPTTGSGYFELFNDAPGLLADALMLDSITALRAALVERSSSTPLAAFFLSQIHTESSSLNDKLYNDVLGVVDFTASPSFI
ncbi:hypothetical protein F4859DRAFT_528354 [Xylaria cf. heliscus]|nr:hypothetical protein F4859DRAFT_528354 [Xylaria cf. heliscus]